MPIPTEAARPVTAGRLLANNISGSATGTGAVTVSNGAILGGTGTITGPVTVNSTSSLLGGGRSGCERRAEGREQRDSKHGREDSTRA